MAPRKFVAYVALVAIVAALFALGWTIKLDAMKDYQTRISCGNSFSTSFSEARDVDDRETLSGYNSNYEQRCKDQVNTRRAWAIPLGVVGMVAFLGALVIRTQERRTSYEAVDYDDEEADVDD